MCSWFTANHKILVPNRFVTQRHKNTRNLGLRAVRILHVAPERSLAQAIGLANNPHIDYVTGDLFVTPSATANGFVEHTIDIQNIPFPNAHFDVVIALHVLEHVRNASRAMFEIRRVLRTSGLAILAVPDARANAITIEGNASMSASERLEVFGQVDHFRRFGRDFKVKLQTTGFESVQQIAIGEWYKNRPESKQFKNYEYNQTFEDGFFYNEPLFFAFA